MASQNPVKIEATKRGFERAFGVGEFVFEGVKTESGVPDQPFGPEETLQGARNRAQNARAQVPDADFYIGLEGGVEQSGKDLYAKAWVSILDTDGRESHSSNGPFLLPPKVAALVLEGQVELSDAADQMFHTESIGTKSGVVSVLTNGAMDRTEYYVHMIILALVPFLKKELY